MNIEKTKEITYYVFICSKCGKEVTTQKNDTRTICSSCKYEFRLLKAKEELNDIICGCEIISAEPNYYGGGEPNSYITEIVIKNKSGEKFKIIISGDENYMEYEKLKDD